MSEESRPNLNAVGLVVDIISSIERHRRGKACQVKLSKIISLVRDSIELFVEDINDILDNEFEE